MSDPVSAIEAEFVLWKPKWERVSESCGPTSVISALDHCGELFPNISKLLQILATLRVTTAQAERAFSKVERTLTAIRSNMTETRLDALVMLQIY